MAVLKFEELLVWKKSQDLAVEIYAHFQENKDFSFRDQIKRAAVSISNNIAEGFDRNSNADFKRFLYFHCHQIVKLDLCYIFLFD